MSETLNTGSDFLAQAESVILEHISEEQFGVSELADAMNMSRSNLLRKIKNETKLSASQFIRQIRLKESLKLLKQSSFTVSEVSYKVGFGSTSYFVKCFREYYGHPPGEVGKREEEVPEKETTDKKLWQLMGVGFVTVMIAVFIIFFRGEPQIESELEKSIAVLPFKNDSNDSTNLYFVNGLMESALGNLQKIENLRVVSRTSVEKYRNSGKDIREIAQELDVNYLVEGSGQKVGDQVMLNIQLIEARTDKHLWAEQYTRKVEDVFTLQNEIARKMVDAIKVIVTPEELERIEKRPTDNLQAYDYYLQALEFFHSRSAEGLEAAIPLYKKAIEHDPTFALAYADLATSYYYLDIFKEEKEYTEEINNYADKALLYDSKSARSLIAKALYYIQVKEYRLALPHLEKALEYNPNSASAVQMIAEHYASFNPNTSKYLEYALKGIQIDISAKDSITRSYTLLHLSNALAQTGFINEAVKYIEQSKKFFPGNPFAGYAGAYIYYARDRDLNQTKRTLIREWKKDTNRLDILQEIGKVYYFQKDFDSAFYYYEKFVNARKNYKLDIFNYEDCKVGYVYEKVGLIEESEELFKSYADYCYNDQSIYKGASLAGLYAHEGKIDEGIEQLKVFAKQENFQYWLVLFFEMDPLIEPLKSHPEFDETMDKIKKQFWDNHEKLKRTLVEKNLLES